MVKVSDLSCIGKSGKPIHGTAAILRRLFGKNEDYYDRETELSEYKEIIRKCGYGYFNE